MTSTFMMSAPTPDSLFSYDLEASNASVSWREIRKLQTPAPVNIPLYSETETPVPLFSENEINVTISDIQSDCIIKTPCTDAPSLEHYLGAAERAKTHTRIITIYSEMTGDSLMITSDLMEKIMLKYAVHVDFLSVMLSFASEVNAAEGASSNYSRRPGARSGDAKLMYHIRYAEPNGRGGTFPWSIRQTGVYHHSHKERDKPDLFIVLQPTKHPSFDNKLSWLAGNSNEARVGLQALKTNPRLWHILLFSTYSADWRWYLRVLGQQCTNKMNSAMITELVSKEELSTTNSMNASFERVNNSMSASFESVKTLRDLNDKLARAEAHCVGNLDILEKLEQSSFFDDNAKEALVAEVSRYKEYIRSTNSLHERLRSITELVGYNLTIVNQREALKVSGKLTTVTETVRDMAVKSVEESATTQALTIVAALYLPASFVGSLLQAQIVGVPEVTQAGGFSATNLRTFFLCWIILVVLTVLIYRLIVNLEAARRRDTWYWLWQAGFWRRKTPTRSRDIEMASWQV